MMKNLTVLGSCLLVYSVPAALAQSPATTSSVTQIPISEKGSQSKTYGDGRSRRTASGKKTTMVGCIFGQDGKYILMTKEHSANLELSSTEDLKAHVGHKVKITGVLDKSSTGNATTGSSSNAQPESMADDEKKPESSTNNQNPANGQLRVSKIKMISESCDMKSDKSPDKSWTHILSL